MFRANVRTTKKNAYLLENQGSAAYFKSVVAGCWKHREPEKGVRWAPLGVEPLPRAHTRSQLSHPPLSVAPKPQGDQNQKRGGKYFSDYIPPAYPRQDIAVNPIISVIYMGIYIKLSLRETPPSVLKPFDNFLVQKLRSFEAFSRREYNLWAPSGTVAGGAKSGKECPSCLCACYACGTLVSLGSMDRSRPWEQPMLREYSR